MADLIRWARNGEQWAQAACDRQGIAWRATSQQPRVSPFVARALARQLPAKELAR